MAMRDIDFINSVPVALGFAENHATPRLLVNPRDRKPIVLWVAAKVQGDRIADCDPVRQPHVVIGSTGGGDDPTAAFGQYPKGARYDGRNIVKTSERRRDNGNSESKSNPQRTHSTKALQNPLRCPPDGRLGAEGTVGAPGREARPAGPQRLSRLPGAWVTAS